MIHPGDPFCYSNKKCRLPQCREARRLYVKRRKHAPLGRVPAEPMCNAVRALHALGYRAEDIARGAGVSRSSVTDAVKGRFAVVNRGTAYAVLAFAQLVGDTPGPSQRTRTTARRKGWLPPIWWGEGFLRREGKPAA